jgi:hypothetical protein
LPNPAEDEAFSLGRFGTVEAIGTTAAGQRLQQISATHITAERETVFRAFRHREIRAVPAGNIRDRDVFNLYAIGKLDTDLLPASFSAAQSDYYIPRVEIEEALNHVRNRSRVVVLHSYLGNGKTLLTKGIAYRAYQENFKVFEFDRDLQTLSRECELIRRSSMKTLIIIEEYQRHYDLIEKLLLGVNSNLHKQNPDSSHGVGAAYFHVRAERGYRNSR